MELRTPSITVMGVGGVGGLLAGALVRRYGDAVSLVARGRRGEHLRAHGLTLHSDLYGELTVRPARVVEDPAELGVQDVVLVCVKNDGLARAAEQVAPIVGPDTVVLPVMNGVRVGEQLRAALPGAQVLESVIYTVSSAGEDFSITQKGKFTTIYTGGTDAVQKAAAERLCGVLKAADIDCRHAGDVMAAVWSKYVLNCAYNVVTARWGINIGQIKASESLTADYLGLMTEAFQVGRARGVALPDDLLDKHMKRLANTTDDSTSSLSRDFDAGRAGEMEVFSGEVVRMAAQAGVPAPLCNAYYEGLKQRAAAFG